MSARFDHIDDYLEQYAKQPSDFFSTWRAAAATQLQARGFPGLKTEAWKYTNSKPLLQNVYAAAKTHSINASIIVPHLLKDAYHLVLVNGYIDTSLSTLPATGIVCSLQQASIQYPELLKNALTQFTLADEPGFFALNTLLFSDGFFIHFEKNTQLDKPLHILHYADNSVPSSVIHGRQLVVLEANANAVIIEQSLGVNNYWRNQVGQLWLDEGARLQYYQIQQESMQALHTSYVTVQQQRDSHFTHFNFDRGGQWVRHDLKATLKGAGAYCQSHGLYLTRDTQHVDNHTDIIHSHSHTTSDEYYKGIIADKSRAVFNGRICVEQGIAGIESNQKNHNLLLSDTAEIDTKPELEIYADDVKCSHGATIGQLDPAALFYLISRGISPDAAQQLLTYGFAYEALERIDNIMARDFFTTLLTQWFANESQLKELF